MPRRILVVDDDASVCRYLATVLSRAGYHVVAEEHGQAAIARARSEPFDLLIIDKNLPGLTGFDVIDAIRTITPAVPALLMTAYPEPLLAGRVRLQGYLSKPFESIPAVCRAVERVLSQHPSEAGTGREDDADEVTPVVSMRRK